MKMHQLKNSIIRNIQILNAENRDKLHFSVSQNALWRHLHSSQIPIFSRLNFCDVIAKLNLDLERFLNMLSSLCFATHLRHFT